MSYSTSSTFTNADFLIPTQPGRKYQKCSSDFTLFSNTDLDNSIHSSESSNHSQFGSLSTSTNPSTYNELDMDSISGLNSQLFNSYPKESQKHVTLSSYHHRPGCINDTDYDNHQYPHTRSNRTKKHKNVQAYNTVEKIKRNDRNNNLEKFLRRDDNRRQYELSKEQSIQHDQFLRHTFDTSEDDEDYDADYDDDNDDGEDIDIDNSSRIGSNTQNDAHYNDLLQHEIDEMEYLEELELEEQFQSLNI